MQNGREDGAQVIYVGKQETIGGSELWGWQRRGGKSELIQEIFKRQNQIEFDCEGKMNQG